MDYKTDLNQNPEGSPLGLSLEEQSIFEKIRGLSWNKREEKLDTVRNNLGLFNKALHSEPRYVGDALGIINSAISDRKISPEPPEFALQFIEDNSERIEAGLRDKDYNVRRSCLDTLSGLVEHGDTRRSTLGFQILKKNLDIFIEQFADPKRYNLHVNIAQFAPMVGYKNEAGQPMGFIVLEEVADKLSADKKQAARIIPQIIGQLYTHPNKNIQTNSVFLLDNIVKTYGFNLFKDKLLLSWLQSHLGFDSHDIEQNLSAMMELEAQQPGAARVLYDEFGIIDFGRYTTETLLRQVKARHDTDKPYGVVLTARYDAGGAFYERTKDLDYISRSSEGKFNLRLIEGGNKYELTRALLTARRKYGPASFAFIAAHGLEDRIKLGLDTDDVLIIDDLKDRGGQRGSEFFVPNSTVVLLSCETGKAEGLAKHLSEVIDGQVIAPNSSSSVRAISVDISEDGKPKPDITYGVWGLDLSKMIYDKGVLIHDSQADYHARLDALNQK